MEEQTNANGSKTSPMKRLLIVESPTKAKTISKYLPKSDYRIEASMGHVRDLPASASQIPAKYKKESWASLGVRTDNGFKPLYVVPPEKKKVIRELKKALNEADELLIATDEDREGEAIGWHILQVLSPKIPTRRMVFHEITKEAITAALGATRSIDQRLVDAQEARRVLDRLVGYQVSPVLWRKIAPKLAAGRVQSVAVRLLVLRERERIAFVPASYWDLTGELERHGQRFKATMTHLGSQRLATGRDFDDATGKLKDNLKGDILLLSETGAKELEASLPGAPWRVANVEQRDAKRMPAAPFITSTLQQEASRKLRLGAKQTMRLAQSLYEKGHITYMRTDSVHLSQEAVKASRRAVERRYGKEYVSKGPRQYKSKVRNAQEAHEAIRPAGNKMKTMDELGLSGMDARLYDLIWKRTVASQMADCRLRFNTATIKAPTPDGETATFRATGRTIIFPGFFRAYVEGSDDPEATLENTEMSLPLLAVGDVPTCHGATAHGHETKAPARFTEASLIKMLEKEGIGRPSTYAAIMGTIQDRGSARRAGNALVPTFMAFATNKLLESQFEQLVDLGFTAAMEQVLDDIAAGKQDASSFLRTFYKGDHGLEHRIEAALSSVDPRTISTITFPQWGSSVVRVGKFGAYAEGELSGETRRVSLPDDLLPSDITAEMLQVLLEAGSAPDHDLGVHPEFNQPMLLKKGRYGPYVQLGDDDQEGKPRRMSLPKGVSPADVTRDLATQLLSLPRQLGDHPDTGRPIMASIGRYGPYVQHERSFASLEEGDDVLVVGLARALALLAKRAARTRPLRTLGPHPESGDPVEVWKGRYGPYVKHRKINATLKEGRAPETVTLEEALELLAARASKRRGRKR